MTKDSAVTKNQKRTFVGNYEEGGERFQVKATVRFDDQCGNGHNTFSVTGDVSIYNPERQKYTDFAGGCVHQEIARAIPEIAHLIKWHLCSTDGPMHYIENVLYLAGDRDCWGLRKGEFRQMADKKSGLPLWQLDVSYSQYQENIASETQPQPVTLEYRPYGRTGEGKDREYESARKAAIWPDATNEELSLPPEELRRKLEDRLPGLMAEFRKDVESLGFSW